MHYSWHIVNLQLPGPGQATAGPAPAPGPQYMQLDLRAPSLHKLLNSGRAGAWFMSQKPKLQSLQSTVSGRVGGRGRSTSCNECCCQESHQLQCAKCITDVCQLCCIHASRTGKPIKPRLLLLDHLRLPPPPLSLPPPPSPFLHRPPCHCQQPPLLFSAAD